MKMWEETGITEIEGRIEALKITKIVDHNVGSDFESACEYFVKQVTLPSALSIIYY